MSEFRPRATDTQLPLAHLRSRGRGLPTGQLGDESSVCLNIVACTANCMLAVGFGIELWDPGLHIKTLMVLIVIYLCILSG